MSIFKYSKYLPFVIFLKYIRKVKESSLPKYPKNLNNINIGMIFFAVMAIYIIISVVTYLRKDHMVGYQVMAGSLSTNNIYDAVAVRQEEIVTSEIAGYVN